MSNYIIWFTGIPSSGKTTLATILYNNIFQSGKSVVFLDGDNVRKWLSPDLGYSNDDRLKQMDRLYGMSKLLQENGILGIICTNTPPINHNKDILTIYIKCSLEECMKRDVKHLYEKYKNGEMKNIIGLDLDYVPPDSPFLTLETDKYNVDECIDMLMIKLKRENII